MMDEPQPEHPTARIRRSRRRWPLPIRAVVLFGLAGLPARVAAQDEGTVAPPGFARHEVERSRSCVSTLAELAELDLVLDPLALRSRRFMGIAQAVALEDRSIETSLNIEDPTEGEIRDWFVTDSLLAARYVSLGDEAIQEQRTRSRDAIKERIAGTLRGIQAQADSVLAENQDLVRRSGPCEGAIFVRPAVLEACANGSGAICDAARAPATEAGQYRFAESAEAVWEIQELRPWTAPSPLRAGPNGLEGGRTIGYARVGNVVVTVAFSPLLKERARTTAAELVGFQQTNQALGLTFEHPDIVFTPALGLRASLPEAISGETRYVLHFGPAGSPQVVWTGAAGTGAALVASVPLTPTQVLALRDGNPLALTALDDDDVTVFSIALSTINQSPSVSSLLDYMESQLMQDVKKLAPPKGEGG